MAELSLNIQRKQLSFGMNSKIGWGFHASSNALSIRSTIGAP
jgi:hypothetical protein